MPSTYGKFRPTQFDHHLDIQWEPSDKLASLQDELEKLEELAERHEECGLILSAEKIQQEAREVETAVRMLEAVEDRNNWLLVPVSVTRDGGPYDQSNFAAALEMLGGESETVEVHRFGHWGPGWFEVIIAHPSLINKVKEIESALESYPILDEGDFSERENGLQDECWDSYGRRDFEKQLLSTLENMASELVDSESVIEREVREMAEQHEFSPDDGLPYSLTGKPIPTPADRLFNQIAKIENYSAAQIRWLWNEADGECEMDDRGANFEIDRAVKLVINTGLFWDEPPADKEMP
jgi:hypothetical protein